MPIYHDGKKMKPYRGYRKPVNIYYGDKKVAGWKNSTQTGNNLTFQTTYNDTADVVVKGKSLQKSEWHKAEAQSTQSNPMINRVPEHMRKFEGWTAYQGASVTLTQNISVPEWGTDEATRIQTTGGSTTTKYYYGISAVIWGGPLSDGRKTQILVDVKNIGTAQVIISCNLGNDVAVNPGETKSITLNGTGNGISYWTFSFKALSTSDNLDFIAYNPRAYILDEIPLPDNPFPIQTTIQAGTYKVQDYKGDWYEFTLTEDLHGIDDVRDSVEWDKYGHKGFESRKIGQILSYTDEIIETAYMSTTGGLDTGAYVCYVLATPTRTPLIFTKNNDSTAPECPMEFLTDTPSIEYPAEVFDASGTVKVRGKNLLPFPLDLETYTVKHHGSPPRTSSTQTDEFVRIQGAEEEIDTAFRLSSPMFSLNSNTTYTISFRAYVDSPTFTLWDMTSLEWSVALVSQSGVRLSQQQYLNTVQKTWTTYKFVATTNSEGLYYLRLGSDSPNLINGFILIDRHSIQIELGSTATSYEPYRPEVSATIPPLRSNQDGTVYDEFEVKTGKVTRKIGRIESYNGEDVGDDWISSTGALDTGATVEYVLAKPIEEQHTPVTLPTYYPTTVITTTNDTPAELTTTATVKVEDV
jgi:hypothetical protein